MWPAQSSALKDNAICLAPAALSLSSLIYTHCKTWLSKQLHDVTGTPSLTGLSLATVSQWVLAGIANTRAIDSSQTQIMTHLSGSRLFLSPYALPFCAALSSCCSSSSSSFSLCMRSDSFSICPACPLGICTLMITQNGHLHACHLPFTCLYFD